MVYMSTIGIIQMNMVAYIDPTLFQYWAYRFDLCQISIVTIFGYVVYFCNLGAS